MRFHGCITCFLSLLAFPLCTAGAEAVLMDPQQRLLLECTEEALAAARLSVQGAVTGTPLLSWVAEMLPFELKPRNWQPSARPFCF
jgi:hypothetical protein